MDEKRRAYQKAYQQRNRDTLLTKQRARGKLYYQANKEAIKAKTAAWRAANPDKVKAAQLAHRERNAEKMRERSKAHYRANRTKALADTRVRKLARYGMTPSLYKTLMERQRYECPICERAFAWPTVATVDHSHATGAVRGILCRKCNAAIGLFQENTDNLERALEYLSVPRLLAFRRWWSGVTSTTNSAPSRRRSTPPE